MDTCGAQGCTDKGLLVYVYTWVLGPASSCLYGGLCVDDRQTDDLGWGAFVWFSCCGWAVDCVHFLYAKATLVLSVVSW